MRGSCWKRLQTYLAQKQSVDPFCIALTVAIKELPIPRVDKKVVLDMMDRFVIIEGILYYTGKVITKGKYKERYVVPKASIPPGEWRQTLIARYHAAVHQGSWKLFHTLADKYYW